MSKTETKVLNIDALAKAPTRSLTLAGVNYPIPDMTVDNFIETTSAAERLKNTDAGVREQVEATIEMIVRSMGFLGDEKGNAVKSEFIKELRKLTLEQLGVIVQFIQGDYDPNKDESAPEEAQAEGNALKP